MSMFELFLVCRSIRRYENKEISQEVLGKIMEAGRQSPWSMVLTAWSLDVGSCYI